MIKNIIFDVGKVLVDWQPEEAMHRLGMDDKTVAAVAEATVCTDAWNEADRSAAPDEELLQRLIDNAPEYEKEIRLFWENVDMAISQYDYSRAWVQSLKKKGYHVYILSNYSRWTYNHTQEALSFLADVDGALFSFDVQQIKPEPAIYQSLLARFDLAGEECVFLDDRRENIEAAEREGINGIIFTGYEDALKKLQEYGVTV